MTSYKRRFLEYLDMHQIEKSMIWELLKIRVKEFSIKYCSVRKQKHASNIRMLESEIKLTDREIESVTDNNELIEERKSLKDQLDALYMDVAIGAQIRSKVKFVEEGERSTAYCLAVEKHRQSNNNIKALTNHGITHSDDIGILKVASDFYADLFSSTNPNQEDVNENVTLPVLTLEKQHVCEGDILEQECVNAIKKMKSNKSPGEDGLPIEFYRTLF